MVFFPVFIYIYYIMISRCTGAAAASVRSEAPHCIDKITYLP
jgi:hypothetical protein